MEAQYTTTEYIIVGICIGFGLLLIGFVAWLFWPSRNKEYPTKLG